MVLEFFYWLNAPVRSLSQQVFWQWYTIFTRVTETTPRTLFPIPPVTNTLLSLSIPMIIKNITVPFQKWSYRRIVVMVSFSINRSYTPSVNTTPYISSVEFYTVPYQPILLHLYLTMIERIWNNSTDTIFLFTVTIQQQQKQYFNMILYHTDIST